MWPRDNEVHDGLLAVLAGMARSPALHHEAPETQRHCRLEPQPGDIVVRKPAWGILDHRRRPAARGPRDHHAHPRQVSTSSVVLSSAREAADRDYHIDVRADACADRDPHVHACLTDKILPMQAHLVTVADLPGLIVTTGRPAAATNTAMKVRT